MKYVYDESQNFVSSGAVFQDNQVYRSQRIEALRNLLVDEKPAICSERAVLLTESYRNTENEPILIRRARALANILENLSVTILSNELIVGSQGMKIRCASIFPEFGLNWVIEELDGKPVRPENRPGDRYIISEEDETNIRGIAKYWKGKTHEDRVRAGLPEESLAAWQVGVINSHWLMIGGDGHITVNLKKIIDKGIISVISEAKDRLANLNLAEPEDIKQKTFLESVVISCESVITFANRYSRLAKKMAMKEKNEVRKKELEKIADVCQRVPAYPARDFHEALQSCWFINLVIQIENNGHSISLGRFDQNLINYYRKDMNEGSITSRDARELLECLWLKLFQLHKITSWDNTKYFSGYPMFQNVTIGGQNKNGADVTNELSYLVLETQAAIQLSTPSISFRYHDRSSDVLLQAATDIIKLGGGQPAFYSDEVYVPALVNRGIPWDDAVNYSIVGCAEAIIEGKQSGRPNGAGFVNLGKILELSLNSGKDPVTGMSPCPGDGDLDTLSSFEKVFDSFKKQAA